MVGLKLLSIKANSLLSIYTNNQNNWEQTHQATQIKKVVTWIIGNLHKPSISYIFWNYRTAQSWTRVYCAFSSLNFLFFEYWTQVSKSDYQLLFESDYQFMSTNFMNETMSLQEIKNANSSQHDDHIAVRWHFWYTHENVTRSRTSRLS